MIICLKEDCIYNEHENNDSPNDCPCCTKDVVTITDELLCEDFEKED